MGEANELIRWMRDWPVLGLVVSIHRPTPIGVAFWSLAHRGHTTFQGAAAQQPCYWANGAGMATVKEKHWLRAMLHQLSLAKVAQLLHHNNPAQSQVKLECAL